MRISIITPVLDEASGLAAFLTSLEKTLAETHAADSAIEPGLLVVDGGSVDGSDRLLDDHGVAWISSRRGRASQMNAGAAATDGEVLLFLHADSILPLGSLLAVRDAVATGAVGGFFPVRLDSSKSTMRLVGNMISWRSRATRVGTGDQALFATRAAFDELGGFGDMPLFEDVDFSKRLRSAGRVAVLQERVVTSARRWENKGAWRTIMRMWILRGLWTLGVPADKLVGHYGDVR